MKLAPVIAIAKTAARAAIMVCAAAMTWLLFLSIAGAACVVSGIYLLAGAGWALVAAGVILVAGAIVLHRGMTNG